VLLTGDDDDSNEMDIYNTATTTAAAAASAVDERKQKHDFARAITNSLSAALLSQQEIAIDHESFFSSSFHQSELLNLAVILTHMHVVTGSSTQLFPSASDTMHAIVTPIENKSSLASLFSPSLVRNTPQSQHSAREEEALEELLQIVATSSSSSRPPLASSPTSASASETVEARGEGGGGRRRPAYSTAHIPYLTRENLARRILTREYFYKNGVIPRPVRRDESGRDDGELVAV
jgi:hypothetical protein